MNFGGGEFAGAGSRGPVCQSHGSSTSINSPSYPIHRAVEFDIVCYDNLPEILCRIGE